MRIFVALLLFAAFSALSTDYYLDGTSGSDSYNGTAPAFVSGSTGPKATFSAAAALLSAGDSLYIRAGTYAVQFTANSIPSGSNDSTRTLVSNYEGETVIFAPSGAVTYPFFANSGNYKAFSGIIIDAASCTSVEAIAGVRDNATYMNFTNMTFRNNSSAHGILMSSSGGPNDYCKFFGTTILNCGKDDPESDTHGVYLSGNDNTTFIDTVVSNVFSHAFHLRSAAQNNVISNLVAYDCNYGIGFREQNSSTNKVYNLIFSATSSSSNNYCQDAGGVYLAYKSDSNTSANLIEHAGFDGYWSAASRGFQNEGTNCIARNIWAVNMRNPVDPVMTVGTTCTLANYIVLTNTSSATSGAGSFSGGITSGTMDFVDWSGGNYRIAASSDAIGAGTTDASVEYDLDGNAYASPPAIGPYEYISGGGGGDPAEAVKRRGKIPGLGRGRGSWR